MNLLLTGAWRYRDEAIYDLRAHGHEICFMSMEGDVLPCPGEWVQGVVCNGLFLHHSLDEFPNLKYIQLTSAGFDRVPMERIRERGILIHNARGVYSTPMAEFALSGVLHFYKEMDFFCKNQALHRWEKHRGLLEVEGKTLCVLGCGSVGQACAKVFSALGCRVVGVDIAAFSCELFSQIYPLEELDQILPMADIVILCLPLAPDTLYLFDQTRFSNMKDGAIFVNISRGQIVDTTALLHALRHKLRGAVLDVFEEEPLAADHPLWGLENVIITPHNSFVGDGNSMRLEKMILDNLESFQ